LSIASVLQKYHDVEFVDAAAEGYRIESEVKPDLFRFGLPDAEVLARLDSFKPDVVGVTDSFTAYWGTTYDLLKSIRRHAPHVVTIAGGHHVSEAAEDILRLDSETRCLDIIVLKEGEASIVPLMRSIEERRAPVDVPGIAWRGPGGEIHVQPFRTWIPNLDDIPDPAWHLMRTSVYCKEMSHHGPPRGSNFLDMLFSRGCPTGCHYCTSTSYWGKRVRYFSEERVRHQVETVRALGWKEIVVEDDNFLALPRHVQRYICRALKDSGLHWCNDGGLYLPLVTEASVEMLAESGCYRVFLPLEHPRVGVMHRNHKYLQIPNDAAFRTLIRRVTRMLRSAGIEFYCSVMVGFEGETCEALCDAVALAEFVNDECGAMGTAFHWVQQFPGTQLAGNFKLWQISPEMYSLSKMPSRWDVFSSLVPARLRHAPSHQHSRPT